MGGRPGVSAMSAGTCRGSKDPCRGGGSAHLCCSMECREGAVRLGRGCPGLRAQGPPQCPTSEVKAPDHCHWGVATMEAIPRLYTPAQRPPGAWWVGADPVGRGPVRRRRGPCRERCWPSMQEGESGALSLLRSRLQAAAACPRAGVKPLLLKILFQNQAEGVPLPTSPLLAGSGICLIAELGGAG